MSIHVDVITRIKKIIKERGDKPLELLNPIFEFLGFKRVEIQIYNLLLEKSLTISQIRKELKVSERTIREYMKRLLEKGVVVRTVRIEKRLKYVYSALSPEKAWKMMKEEIQKTVEEISETLERIAL